MFNFKKSKQGKDSKSEKNIEDIEKFDSVEEFMSFMLGNDDDSDMGREQSAEYQQNMQSEHNGVDVQPNQNVQANQQNYTNQQTNVEEQMQKHNYNNVDEPTQNVQVESTVQNQNMQNNNQVENISYDKKANEKPKQVDNPQVVEKDINSEKNTLSGILKDAVDVEKKSNSKDLEDEDIIRFNEVNSKKTYAEKQAELEEEQPQEKSEIAEKNNDQKVEAENLEKKVEQKQTQNNHSKEEYNENADVRKLLVGDIKFKGTPIAEISVTKMNANDVMEFVDFAKASMINLKGRLDMSVSFAMKAIKKASVVDAIQEKYEQLQRDFEGNKKRNADLQEKSKIEAVYKVLEKILPTLDNFERAASFIPDKSVLEGVQLIERQLMGQLQKMGVKEIEALGADFDPNFHEAVTIAEAPTSDQVDKVIEVMQKGFMCGEKVLRYARVKVGK